MLTIDTLTHDAVAVRDTDGGIWWADMQALTEILASDDPEQAALHMCEEQPMRGIWRS